MKNMESTSKDTTQDLKDRRITELEEQLSQAQVTIQTLIGQVQQLELLRFGYTPPSLALPLTFPEERPLPT